VDDPGETGGTQEVDVMRADFGDRLRELRRTAGISQVELAGDRLSPSYISLLEAGKRHPSEEVIQLLAERLHCTVHDLSDPVSREQAQRARLDISFARLALANGETDDARRRLEALLPSMLRDQEAADEIRFLLAEVYWRDGEPTAAVGALLPVYEHCLARTSHLPLTTVGMRLTLFYADAGDLQAAIRYGEQALQAMAEQGLQDTDEYLRAAASLLGTYYDAGDLAHATAWAATMIEKAERQGSAPGQASLYWNAALVAELQGRLGDAVQLSQRALALLSEQNNSRDLGVLYVTCAHFLLQVDPGQAREAIGLLERALPMLKDFASAADLGEWEGTRARAALALGELVAAEDFARQAVVTLAKLASTESARAHVTLGDALAAQGRQAEAARSYLAASDVLELCPQARKASPIWREVADRLAESGRADAAMVAYRRALDTAGVRPGARSAVTPAATATTVSARPTPAPRAADGDTDPVGQSPVGA
jgi:tetratricopeptide (TPR) repeat protein